MTYVICALLKVREGREQAVVEAMRELVPLSRAEPGCLAYEALRSVVEPRTFMFYERWADEAAYRAHTETEHFRRLVGGTLAPAIEHRDRRVYTETDG